MCASPSLSIPSEQSALRIFEAIAHFPFIVENHSRHVKPIDGDENVVKKVPTVSAVNRSAAGSSDDLVNTLDLDAIVEMLMAGEVDIYIVIDQ